MSKKLVMFDFDGVLVDTLIMHYHISKQINTEMSLTDFQDRFNGNIYESFKKDPSIKQHPTFFEEYEEQSRELVIPESLKDLLKKLKDKYYLTIVSSTPSNLILKILEQENCEKYFVDILGSDIHTSKVVKIKMLLEKFKIEPGDSIFITDTTGDILEARKCEVGAIAVSWGFHEKERLVKSNPFKIVDNPEDLLGTILDVLK